MNDELYVVNNERRKAGKRHHRTKLCTID